MASTSLSWTSQLNCDVCWFGNIDDCFVRGDCYSTLSLSAKRGCLFCRLLVQVIGVLGPLDQSNERYFKFESSSDRRLQLSWTTGDSREPPLGNSIDIFALADEQHERTSISIQNFYNWELGLGTSQCPTNFLPWVLSQGKVISGNTSSDQSLQAAISWIDNCITSHPKCGAGTKNPLPTRILDLSSRGSTSDEVYLFLTSSEPARYACLSYCWGAPQLIPKTTMENLEERCRGISVSELPSTFRDAIICTRNLGMRFLWIDSLCIIQDDPSDWRHESAQMANIYRNSYITLAAAKSADVLGGLFPRAEPSYVGRRFTSTGSSGTAISLSARISLPHDNSWHCTTSEEVPNSKTADLPLFHRGWAFQERLVAPRVLNFCSAELVMECMTETVCECSRGSSSPGYPKLDFAHTILHSHQEMEFTELYWNKLASKYSRLQLTFGSDKLPAISGIAKLFNERTKSVYLAGLWSNVLFSSLCWAVTSPGGRPLKWRAPSWTWAGSDVPINFLAQSSVPNHSTQYADVVDYHCETLGGDSTAGVVSGHLAISGTLSNDFKLTAKKMGSAHITYFAPDMNFYLTKGFNLDTTIVSKAFYVDAFPAVYWMGIIVNGGSAFGLLLKQTEATTESIPNMDM